MSVLQPAPYTMKRRFNNLIFILIQKLLSNGSLRRMLSSIKNIIPFDEKSWSLF